MITTLKVIHIVSFVAWFAGIFYIWRLFVYHCENEHAEVKRQLAVMEYKLYKYIMRLAAFFTVASGFSLLYMFWQPFHRQGWLWVKLFLVALILFNHFSAEYYRKQLAAGKNYSSKKFRILNEVPTLLLILIVYFVMAKPF